MLAFQKSTEDKFNEVFHYISEHEEFAQKIFVNGQIYDAFSLLVDLVARAEKRLVLVDNYVDINTLNIIAKKKRGCRSHCIYGSGDEIVSKGCK